MPRFVFTIRGANQVQASLATLGSAFPAALGRALYRFAELDITSIAKEAYVPVVTGALRSSIRTEEPVVTRTSAFVMVAAGGAAVKYALRVHENPRAGRTGGVSPQGRRYKRWSRVGQWKFLETPAMLAAQSGLVFAREAGAELDAVIHGLR